MIRIVFYILFAMCILPSMQAKPLATISHNSLCDMAEMSDLSDINVIFVDAKACPDCVGLNPTWDALQKHYADHSNIKFIRDNLKDQSDAIKPRYNCLESVPSIIVVDKQGKCHSELSLSAALSEIEGFPLKKVSYVLEDMNGELPYGITPISTVHTGLFDLIIKEIDMVMQKK